MKYLWLILALLLMAACGGGNPADIPNNGQLPPSSPGILTKIEINGAKTLALAPTDTQALPGSSNAVKSASVDCQELGKLQGAIYSALEIEGTKKDIKSCFKKVKFWKEGAIYGQYRPEDASADVWFVTDAEGNVFHLPGTPRKGQDFKNDALVRMFKGKPLYLAQNGSLKEFNFEDATEETVLAGAYKRFEVLSRPDGDHLVYLDWDGAGKRMKPDGSVENVNQIENTGFFFANASQDLTYTGGTYFKNMIFDDAGNMINDASSIVPLAYAEWIGTIGQPQPMGPVFMSIMANCDKRDELMICDGKGYLLADSSGDMREINWCEFGHCGWAGGWEDTQSCINQNNIFFYSPGYDDPRLTKISRCFSQHEDILTNIEIDNLQCAEDKGVLIRGTNTDSGLRESFHLKDNVKTILTRNISEIIR